MEMLNPIVWFLALLFALVLVGVTRLFRSLRGNKSLIF